MPGVLLAGAGGLAREFVSWFGGTVEIVGCIGAGGGARREDLPGSFFDREVPPHDTGTDQAVIAVGSPALKRKIHTLLKDLGYRFPIFVHPSSIVCDSASLAPGAVVSPHVAIGPGASLGVGAYVNMSCSIGHDATVGAFAQINPGTHIGGGVRIGDGVLVGAGSTVVHQKAIGEDATVGAGATVLADVAAGITVLGNPARRLPVAAGD